jgi:parvulin-like peptidyl-prolyl isomerase
VCAWGQTTAAAPAASSIPDDRVVLSVGGTELSKKAFELILGSVTEEARAAGDPKKAVATNISGLLQVAQEARAAKFDQDPTQAIQLKLRAEQALATAYLVDQMNKMADEAFLKDWFTRNQSAFSQWKARHVLIRMQGSVVPVRKGLKDLTDTEAAAKAKAVRAKLVAPGADFSAIAKLDSDDVGSSGNGGDLGFFGAGQMVAAVEEAVSKMKVNEISEPIKTEFGYHIVQLQEVRVKPFDEAKEEVKEKSRGELQTKIIEAIRLKHPVKLDTEYFGQ